MVIPQQKIGSRAPAFVTEYLGMAAALVSLVTVFSLSTENFFTVATFKMIANQIPDKTIVAVGMTLVLIIAGIDLSVGSVLALSGAVLGFCMVNRGWPLATAIPACLGVGIICGLLNGLVVIRWKLPAFIVTLGMLEIARGATYWVTDSRNLYIGGPVEVIAETSLFDLIGGPVPLIPGISIFDFSLPFIIAVLIVVIAQVILSCSVFGRYLIAIGTNEEAVRLSGIDPRPIKLTVFILCGLLTSIAAVLHTSRISSANPNAGAGLELQAIAAVVIGGTSLMGGRGSVVRTFFGVLIIEVLGRGLDQVGAQESTKRLVTGCVIVAAVILDYYRHRLGARGANKAV